MTIAQAATGRSRARIDLLAVVRECAQNIKRAWRTQGNPTAVAENFIDPRTLPRLLAHDPRAAAAVFSAGWASLTQAHRIMAEIATEKNSTIIFPAQFMTTVQEALALLKKDSRPEFR